VLVAETARASGHSPERVRSIVEEWIGRRPLAYLAGCRHPGLVALFAGLRWHGKVVGILSDYPAKAKLDALALRPDRVVCAGDESVGLLKPNPRGLEVLIGKVGATAPQTVLIGDRVDRDGVAARPIGAWPLFKSAKLLGGWLTFVKFDEAIFHSLLPRQLPRGSRAAQASTADSAVVPSPVHSAYRAGRSHRWSLGRLPSSYQQRLRNRLDGDERGGRDIPSHESQPSKSRARGSSSQLDQDRLRLLAVYIPCAPMRATEPPLSHQAVEQRARNGHVGQRPMMEAEHHGQRRREPQ
jgi:hypothetical protein